MQTESKKKAHRHFNDDKSIYSIEFSKRGFVIMSNEYAKIIWFQDESGIIYRFQISRNEKDSSIEYV